VKSEKRRKLETAGWRVGDARDFLGLSPSEAEFEEISLAYDLNSASMPFADNRDFALRVVGESFYEENLRYLCGPAADHMRQREATAVLTLEHDNPKDRNAVRVDVDGLTVGHLSRSDALSFRSQYSGRSGDRFECNAVLISVRGGEVCDYGVRLDEPSVRPY
jgi:hypothetical protein